MKEEARNPKGKAVCLIAALISISGCCIGTDCNCGGPPYDSSFQIVFGGAPDSSFLVSDSLEVLDSSGTRLNVYNYWNKADSTIKFHSGKILHGKYLFTAIEEDSDGVLELNIPKDKFSETWCMPKERSYSGPYQADTIQIKSILFYCRTTYTMPGCP